MCIARVHFVQQLMGPQFLPCSTSIMIILSWNVRGVGNLLKCCRIKDALTELRPDWIGIQESKLSMVDPLCIG